MASVVVVGTQWGDEGKGKITDLLAAEADIVVRYAGGANAGHTVIVGEETFKLHQIPSGILFPGKICLAGNGVVLDPGGLLAEADGLAQRGISLEGLRISDRAQVVMPWHRLLDELEEAERRPEDKIGTTGKGIGPCYVDKVARLGIRVSDLIAPGALEARLDAVLPVKNRLLERVYGHPGFDRETILAEYRGYADRLRPFVVDGTALLEEALARGRKVLFEGAQGSLLDIDHGTYPFVTSSTVVAAGAASGAGVGPKGLDRVVGVVKAYTSRVGRGPFVTELADDTGALIRERGHEYGTTTGRPRRVGWFDAVAVRRAVRVNGIDLLAVMSLDVLGGLPLVRLCTAYRHRGRLIQDFPADLRVLEECEPVYEDLPGWPDGFSSAEKVEDLPENAQRYLQRLADLAGAPVGIVSTGRERHQTLVLTPIWR
ncbi:MAG TPA: adenylosuccinate synthase [Firmicutes bacterium]|nr:adenylosuccinate synthase [Bacillota bacterium]